MRIAQLAPLAEAVPPKLYGGTERVVSWLTEELVDMGHEVTLFASGDSTTNAGWWHAPPVHFGLIPAIRISYLPTARCWRGSLNWPRGSIWCIRTWIGFIFRY